MSSPGEINGLLGLLDDPDEDIYLAVAEKIIALGREIIPRLESVWETTRETEIQERIETLIHRVYFKDLQQDFLDWADSEHPELLQGAILLSRYHFPGLNEAEVIAGFDQYRKSVWLELNNFMSPLEQVHVINSILYRHYHIQGHELAERKPVHFFISSLLDTHQGNTYAIGILYLSLCELLDIPIFAVDVPRQFIFAYIDTVHNYIFPDKEGIPQIQFYLDPSTGVLFNHQDVMAYMKKINAPDQSVMVTPMSARQIMRKMLQELAQCYRYNKEAQKAGDMESLIAVLDRDTGV